MKFLLKISTVLIIICTFIWGFDYFLKNNIYIKPYNDVIKEISYKYDIEENMIYAMIKVESKFNQNVVSKAQAKGLMQIVDSTAIEVSQKIGIEDFEPSMLYEPEINIEIGTKYFKTLLDKYEDVRLALIAYNAGQGNVDKWLKDGDISDEQSYYNLPYKETTVYWQKVLREYNAYKRIYKNGEQI